MAEPFYWAERGGYYVWVKVAGKRRRKFLAASKRAALDIWKDGIVNGSLRNEIVEKGMAQIEAILAAENVG